MADTAARIMYIAFVARDYMKVEVEDGLPCRSSRVEADIKTVWCMVALDNLDSSINGLPDRGLLDLMKIVPARRMTPGDDEQMAGRDSEGIPKTDDVFR